MIIVTLWSCMLSSVSGVKERHHHRNLYTDFVMSWDYWLPFCKKGALEQSQRPWKGPEAAWLLDQLDFYLKFRFHISDPVIASMSKFSGIVDMAVSIRPEIIVCGYYCMPCSWGNELQKSNVWYTIQKTILCLACCKHGLIQFLNPK